MDLKMAIEVVESGGVVFAAFKDGKMIYNSSARGVKPAMEFLALGTEITRGSCVADRVIGKGSSMIISMSGCERIYAGVISEDADKYLRGRKFDVTFGRRVDHIINRKGDGLCPVEKLLKGIEDPYEGLTVIKTFLKNIGRTRDELQKDAGI